MNNRYVVSLFEDEHDLLAAVRTARERKLKIVDVHSPYAVHGLDAALGVRPSWMSWACAVFAVLGVSSMLFFQYWVGAVDWPVNVGGKPWNSLPAYIPITFEALVFGGGIGMVLTFFVACRLYPGRPAHVPDPRVTDDRFAMVLEEADAGFDLDDVKRLFGGLGAVEVREHVSEEAP